ncbi:hypothetical protein G9A89_009988 [Geosiphon pyriformis]|nr:hypothetical protein G9A89_009988 [Geosiphon pyriformis]
MEDIVPGELSTIKLSKQLAKLWCQETTDKLYQPFKNIINNMSSFEHQVTGLIFDLRLQRITCNNITKFTLAQNPSLLNKFLSPMNKSV